MKKIKYLLILLIGVSVTSCKDYLEVNPNLGIDDEEVYSDFDNMMSAVDRGTQMVLNYFNATHHDSEVGSMSDEMQCTGPTETPIGKDINAGLWQDLSSHDMGFAYNILKDKSHSRESWSDQPSGRAFTAIRALNLCEQGYKDYGDTMTFPDESLYTEEEMRGQILGQIYFLRAFHYFQIIRRYGGMPDMRVAFTPDYNFDQARPSYKQSTDWCVEDLDLAIANLPERYTAAYDVGRPTKTSAKALKAMVLLYAASPLMNDVYPYTAPAEYDDEYLARAVKASAEAIESVESGRARYEWFDWANYKENSTPETYELSNEAVFQPAFSWKDSKGLWPNTGGTWYNSLITHGGINARTIQPTHNAVQWHGTIDGYDMEDVAMSAYASELADDPYSYKYRDPRLKLNIFCNGDDLHTDSQVTPLTAERGGQVRELYADKKQIFTGYIGNKYLWPGQVNGANLLTKKKKTKGQTHTRILSYIRIPQLYLDFAEAANELYGPRVPVPEATALGISVSTAEEAINKVRARVGGMSYKLDGNNNCAFPQLQPVPSYYSDDPIRFREKIRKERGVELFQEFHRWFDIRRWKIAVDLFKDSNNCIKGVDIYTVNGKKVYEEVPLEGAQRVFEPKHYWYPFPTGDMFKLGTFEQNPGW